MPIEFDCLDCGKHVYSFWEHRPKVCLICNFISEAIPEDRDHLRTWLLDEKEQYYWTNVGSVRPREETA